VNTHNYFVLVSQLDLVQIEKSPTFLLVILTSVLSLWVGLFTIAFQNLIQSLRHGRLLVFGQVAERPMEVHVTFFFRVSAVSEVVAKVIHSQDALFEANHYV